MGSYRPDAGTLGCASGQGQGSPAPKVSLLIFLFLKNILFIFKERGREGESKGEEHQLVASHMPPTLDLAPTQACVLIRNQTGNLSVCRLALNPLSHTSQDSLLMFFHRT